MAKLTVVDPSPTSNSWSGETPSKLLKLAPVSITNDVFSYTIAMDDDSTFVVYNFLIDVTWIDMWSSIVVEYSYGEVTIWRPLYSYTNLNAFYSTSPLPDDIIEGFWEEPVVAKQIRITVTPKNTSTVTYLPSINLKYAPAGLSVTEPPRFSSVPTSISSWREQADASGGLRYEVWAVLREPITHIWDVYQYANNEFVQYVFKGLRSREMNLPIPQSGEYYFDPAMQTLIFDAESTNGNPIYVEYLVGGGAKATVPIESLIASPAFDLDIGTIVQIDPNSLPVLPEAKYPSGCSDRVEWTVINNEELQGGYSYWASEYVDRVAEQYLGVSGAAGLADYYGQGTDFQRVGRAPDSFDNEIGSSYRQYWYNNGIIVDGLWKTRPRGYVTFIGPPAQVVPPNVKIIAPKGVKNLLQGELIEPSGDLLDPSLIPTVPNGAVEPAPLIFEISPNRDTEFPSGNVLMRKCAAWKPHLMIFLRERTKYLGSTNWKLVGQEFDSEDDGKYYGVDSEQTGEPYWK